MNFKSCEIMQYIEFYDDFSLLESRIKSLPQLKKYAFILHNNDKELDGTLKKPHFHCVCTFENNVTGQTISKIINVSENFIEKIKTTTDTALLYLIHFNDSSKFPYEPELVIANFNYVSFVNKYKGIKSIDDILHNIATGVIKEYNITDYIDDITYTKVKPRIDRAFHYRQLVLEKERSGKRNMECIFITGPSDCGKTTIARQIAANKHFSCFVSSGGKSPLDDYKGQECIILDDLRDDTFEFNDLLKLTDNNTQSFVGCRYYNKAIFECKLIIATSTKSITDFYCGHPEEMKQLYRRFPVLVKMSEKYVDEYEYDLQTNTYVKCGDTYWNSVYTLKQSKLQKAALHNDIKSSFVTLSSSNNPNSNFVKLANDDLPFVMPNNA